MAESPSLPTRGPVYPAWWMAGAQVVGQDGAIGRLTRGTAGWSVVVAGVGEHLHPNPAFWALFTAPMVTAYQAKQLAYEAGAAVYEAFGTGGVRHWSALSDRERMDGILPAAKFRTDLDGLRSVVMGAVRDALEPYVR